MIIGIDFDNTIVNYDKVFFNVAVRDKLIPTDISKNKISIKKYLLEKGLTNNWKLLQSKVYGKNINKAVPYNGFVKVVNQLIKRKIKFKIVSHKTINPYYGKKLNLHKISKEWLKNNVIKGSKKKLKHTEIFFETSESAKIARIKRLGCTHFVDDLEKILHQLPDDITKILFSPNKTIKKKRLLVLKSWNTFFKQVKKN